MNKYETFQVDAFTSTRFGGNPAEVTLLPFSVVLEDELLQAIAQENNLSETAFVKPVDEHATFETATEFNLRWFTPTKEVNLCGHATLAAASVIFKCKNNQAEEITFHTLSGPLKVQVDKELGFCMTFPQNPPCVLDSYADLAGVLDAVFVAGRPEIVRVAHSQATKKLVVEIKSQGEQGDLDSLNPDVVAMKAAHDGSRVAGVIVTTRCNNKFDFISRYFAPWNGIDEDPVTGSAHTVLAPYYLEQDKLEGDVSFSAKQTSKRGGEMTIHLTKSGSHLKMFGDSVVVREGMLLL